jgi:S-adenosylmethionine hydrolase
VLARGIGGTVRRIIHLTDERSFLAHRSATFHGRDVFAPVAAALATGTAAAALGVETAEMVRLDLPRARANEHEVQGEVIYVDRFGNLVTNVSRDIVERIRQRTVTIHVGPASVTGVAPAYGSLLPGEPGAVVNSWDLLEIAVRDGSARDRLGVGVGAPVVIDVR